MVRSFWVNEFENYDKKFLHDAVAPIQNKVGQLLMSPHVRNILGQVRSRIDARFMMDIPTVAESFQVFGGYPFKPVFRQGRVHAPAPTRLTRPKLC